MNKLFVVCSCPVDTQSGYGARTRDFLRSLIKVRPEWDVKILSQRWGATPFGALDPNKEQDKILLDRIINGQDIKRQPDIFIMVSVPNEMQRMGKYNILLTAGTESNPCSPEFLEGVNRADLTIVSSNFTKEIFEQTKYDKINQQTGQKEFELKLDKPIEVLFEGLNPVYKRIDKSDFDLDIVTEDFAFVMTGHWLQGDLNAYADRKGIALGVKIFLETFKNVKNPPALILKSSGGGYSYMDQEDILNKIDTIRKSVVGGIKIPNVYLIHGNLEDEEMNSLYNHSKVKAFFLPTRGEGFGRPYLEFSAVGKPVIASNYSGHTDFLNRDFTVYVGGKIEPVHPSSQVDKFLIKDSTWFSPDPNQCAAALMSVFEQYKHYEELGRRQGYISRTEFSIEKMEDKLDQILTKNVPRIAVPVTIKLPELKKPENDQK